MNSVERVKLLCKEKKIPISRLERDLGYSNGYIGQLRKGVFPTNRLVEIARYLSVPVEHLLDINEKEKTPTYLLTGEDEAPKMSASNGACEEGHHIDAAYFHIMQDAQDKGIPPEDIQMAIDFIERARRRDQEQ